MEKWQILPKNLGFLILLEEVAILSLYSYWVKELGLGNCFVLELGPTPVVPCVPWVPRRWGRLS